MKISYERLRLLSVIYSAIPILIFFFGWLSVLPAIFFSLLFIGAFIFFIKNSSSRDFKKTHITMPVKTLIVIAAISFAWCFFAGQGGFIHQSRDNIIRNAIFRDLISKPWPVIYRDGSMLSYYIAHWLLPALPGKAVFLISGSADAAFAAGNVFLLIWSFIGIFLALLLICVLTASGKRPRFIAASLMFIFFSGLDVIGISVTSKFLFPMHLEWWAGFAQYSSLTTCLFWVYNQTVVSWLMTLCVLNERSIKNFAFLGLLMLPFGPLPFFGIVFICVFKAVDICIVYIKKHRIAAVFKTVFSPQNILAAVSVLPVFYLYYFSNAIASNNAVYKDGRSDVSLRINRNIFSDGNAVRSAVIYFLFILLEIGIYSGLIIIWNKKHKTVTPHNFIAVIVLLCLLPFFRYGESDDLAMRVSIPLIVYLAAEFISRFMQELPEKRESKSLDEFARKKTWFLVAALVFFSGSITAVTEFYREIYYTARDIAEHSSSEYIETMDDEEFKNNFTAKDFKNSDFYRYIGKK